MAKRIALANAFSAVLRLRGVERNDNRGAPVRADERGAGRHSIARLGDRAWRDTQTLITRLRTQREYATGIRPVLRHIAGTVETYWSLEYGW